MNRDEAYRLPTSVGGAATGEGGDRIVCDDPHNVQEAESDAIRKATLDWWDVVMSTRKFEAIVDSGSSTCLFHADIGKAHGLKLKDGIKSTVSGVIGGAKGEVYYHKVKLCIGSSMIPINAGFSETLSVAALLGRHGFFEHYTVVFDPANNPPGFEIERVYRA